ncbi:hypothetical protein EGW08_013305, partial [Elysia chlorotica]
MTRSFTWIDIDVPFVARHVTISFNSWDGSKPGCSIEFVGYKFYQFWTDSHYLGTHAELQNSSTISTTFIITHIDSCTSTCKTSGFHFFMLNEESIADPSTAICSCLTPTVSTRDFYPSDDTISACLDSQPCSPHLSELTSLYSSSTTTCQLPQTTETQDELTIL